MNAKKEIEKIIDKEIQKLIYPYKQTPAVSTNGEEFLPISPYWSITKLKASLERLYQMGYEEGVKDELKCIENYPKDHPHLYPIYNGQLIEN